MTRMIDGMCPLCCRAVAGRAHAPLFDGALTVCEDALLDPSFPRDGWDGEPLLMQLPYVGDPWLFGAACIHLMAVKRDRGEPAFDVFAERWPIGAALLLEPDPALALADHFEPLGLGQMRVRCTWRILEVGLAGFTGYPREAWRVLVEEDLLRPAADPKVEAWRRWRLYRDGLEG